METIPARPRASLEPPRPGKSPPSPAPKAPVPAMTPAPGATPKPGSEPSLSFTDFDLERYHRPSPVKDEPSAEEEDEAVGTPSAPGKVSGTPGPMPPGAPATPTA